MKKINQIKPNGSCPSHRRRILPLLAALLLVFPLIFGQPAAAATADHSKQISETNEVNLIAVGDDLIHTSVYKAARTNHGYDFEKVFRNTRKYASAADLAVINQETILVDKKYSGYPTFGSPKKVANAIAAAGFNVVTSATNHTMDRGASNILGTLRYWREHYPDIKILGIHSSKKDAAKITVVEKNGIRIAMLNYTYGLNGIRTPSGKGWLVDRLSSRSKIRNDIRKAKKVSDFVIVFPHWGTEYQYKPDSSQKSWAQFFADEGVDLVIGCHPHVIEPCKVVKGKKGNKMLVYYSLGNFVSCQTSRNRMLGGMAEVTIVKDKKGTRIKNYKFSATVTHIGSRCRSFRVYKLDDYTSELAGKNYIRRLSGNSHFTVHYLKSEYKKATGKSYPLTGKFK